MLNPVCWTTSDLELLPEDETKHYQIIRGELFMTRSPHWNHQKTADNICFELTTWCRLTGRGIACTNPGLIFSDVDNVEPDVIWISKERLANLLDESGHLTGAPELIVEVLSPGTTNERRDKEAKLKLYSSVGVQEYWIVDWRLKTVEVYRREKARLELIATFFGTDELNTSLLPNFRCQVAQFFA
jgi:Uma2 family endonuclease